MINTDPHLQQENGLVLIPTPQEEIMWVHPDLVDGQQWNSVTNRRSKGKEKVSFYNVVCASYREVETDILSLTDSEEETIILAAELNKPLVAENSFGSVVFKEVRRDGGKPS